MKIYSELSDAQKELLIQAHMEAKPGETLSDHQLYLLSAVEEMQNYLKKKYPEVTFDVTYFIPAQPASPQDVLMLCPEGGDPSLDTVRVYRHGFEEKTVLEDDYAGAYCRSTLEKNLSDFFVQKLGAEYIQVYTSTLCTNRTFFDGSQMPDALIAQDIVRGSSEIFIQKQQLLDDEIEPLMQEYSEWLKSQKMNATSFVWLCTPQGYLDAGPTYKGEMEEYPLMYEFRVFLDGTVTSKQEAFDATQKSFT